MAWTDRLHSVSRRELLTSALSALGAVSFFAGCGRSENPAAGSPPAAVPAGPTPPQSLATSSPSPLLKTIAIDARVPEALVFPGPARVAGLADITAIQSDTNLATVVIQDSRGRSVAYDSATCFADEVRKRNGKANRQCLAPKVLAAHVLDATRQTLMRRRKTSTFARWQNAPGESPELVNDLDGLRQLEIDFARLQRQAVLDNVSVGALFVFLEQLERTDRTLGSVRWDERGRRIVASFV